MAKDPRPLRSAATLSPSHAPSLLLVKLASAAAARGAQTREPALFDVGWCTSLNANCVVTAGTSLGLWDMRQRSCSLQFREQSDYVSDLLYTDQKNKHTLMVTGGDGFLSVFDLRAGRLWARSEMFREACDIALAAREGLHVRKAQPWWEAT